MNMHVSMHVKGRMYVSTFRAPAMGCARVNSGDGKCRSRLNEPSKPTHTRLPWAVPFSGEPVPWAIRLQHRGHLRHHHQLAYLPSSPLTR